MNVPGFTAEISLYRSSASYSTEFFEASAGAEAAVTPQFRSHVRRQCGPCVNGVKQCFLHGYECRVRKGVPGKPEWGIPPSDDWVSCEPEIFSEWELPC